MAGVGEGRGKSDAQLCQSLLDLYDAADFVFNAILARVKSEQEKLNNLTARIVDREAQVAAIAGTREAITLFSSAKYPQVPTEKADFVPLFGGKQSKFPIATVSVDAGQYQDEEGGTLELFRFFSETNHEYWPREAQSAEGLGRVPKSVKSVADAMLFNSLELPYHLYRVVDNLAGADIVVGEEEPKHKPPPLAAPPQSVLAGDSLITSGVQEYGFRPTLGEVPSFSLPSTLPDLPMVADISWNGSSRQSHSIPLIAPSVGHYRTVSFGDSSAEGTPTKSDTRSLDSSTRFEDFVAPPASNLSQPPAPISIGSGTFPVDTRPVLLSKSEASEIPGSSRLPTIITKTKSTEAVPSPSIQVTPAVSALPSPPPPPPPPPPPLSLRSPAQPTQIKTPTTSSSEIPESSKKLDVVGPSSLPSPIATDPSRAALMAAIRNPGIQLRKTNPGDKSPIDKMQPSNGKQTDFNRAKPVNILSEMASTLKLRRLSMQGAAHDKSQVKSSKIPGNEDIDAGSVSSGSNSAGITLPIKNVHDYIAQKNQEMSDDDDWGE